MKEESWEERRDRENREADARQAVETAVREYLKRMWGGSSPFYVELDGNYGSLSVSLRSHSALVYATLRTDSGRGVAHGGQRTFEFDPTSATEAVRAVALASLCAIEEIESWAVNVKRGISFDMQRKGER